MKNQFYYETSEYPVKDKNFQYEVTKKQYRGNLKPYNDNYMSLTNQKTYEEVEYDNKEKNYKLKNSPRTYVVNKDKVFEGKTKKGVNAIALTDEDIVKEK